MNREFKCEAWDSQSNKMLSWNDLGWMENNDKMSLHTLLSGEYAHFTPRLYTGLTDRNGKEIYEGDKYAFDILMNRGSVEEHLRRFEAVVVFAMGSYVVGSWLLSEGEGEVIGNIYEHAELLEG